jgi:arsenite-activated ATPase ArsA
MEPYVFFGGKGGVGKTTVSCAYAVKCAAAGLETLVVSTDPAHSVTDVFDQDFGDEPRPVEDVATLDAMQIDPEDEVQRHLDDIRADLSEQVSSAMVNEINTQLEMAHQTPGAYESALFDRFVEVMQAQDSYDRVVFDTSPTGSTLRLLGLPEFLEGWIERLAHRRRKSIDLFEKAAVGDRTPRRLMDGDPVLERLHSGRSFSLLRETLSGTTLHSSSCSIPTSCRSTRRAAPSKSSLTVTWPSADSWRTNSLPSPGRTKAVAAGSIFATGLTPRVTA